MPKQKSKKLKQNLFALFFNLFFILSLFFSTFFITLAQAGTEEDVTLGTPTAEDSWGSNASTHNFKVTDYLKVQGQKQSYLQGNDGIPIAKFIVQMINFITLTIGSLSLLAIIAGGFLMLTSHGAENQITKGKEMIKFAVMGLVVTFSAYFIVTFVQSLLYEI